MLDFLSLLAPAIHLVAITPDGPALGRWFGSDMAGAATWAQEQNGAGRNIYFTVNVVREGLNTKPRKADIVAVRFAHVDIDPPESGAWDRDAAVATLRARGAPSVIIDSGNGFQGLWALTSPAVDVETINRGLIEAFDTARGTHNIDRLLRVPDTINYPNMAKLKAGRTVTAATLLTVTAARYTPESLSVSFPYTPTPAASVGTDEIDDIPYTLLSPDDLAPPASAQLRALIDADIPTGQRSEHVSRVVSQMGREGHNDAQVLGILLNPALAVSGHVLDQPNPERAARRKAALAAPHRIDVAAIFGSAPDIPPEALTESPHARLAAIVKEAGFLPHNGKSGLMADEQMALFTGCVYIRSLDVIRVPDGDFLNQSRFDNEFGGHLFVLQNDKPVTDSAWKAFHKNPNYRAPTAHATCFRPDRPAGALIQEEGRALLNTWVPVHTPRASGNPAPFLDFLSRILPSAHDRDILLHYMASMVQNPGVKFQWWPVIQGAEGNGKSYIGRALTRAVGVRYTHLVNPEAMISTGNQFNGWIEGNLFVIIEELGVGHKRDALEILKPLVTNDRMPIERKGVSQVAGDNRVNGVIFTNYKDGVPTKRGNRRYTIFFTAQQEPEDLERDGLTERYFVNLYDWSHGRGTYAGQTPGWHIITQYLADYSLRAELDPAQLAQRAPATTSFDEAIVVGRGPVEQEIMAAIEEDRPGFCGGWISGKALDTLLKATRANIPHNRRADLVKTLGYVTHPGLPEGKTSSVVPPDGVRCRLYVRLGHLSINLPTPQAITEAYTKAQSGSASERVEAVLGR